jgi:hypothetical protein
VCGFACVAQGERGTIRLRAPVEKSARRDRIFLRSINMAKKLIDVARLLPVGLTIAFELGRSQDITDEMVEYNRKLKEIAKQAGKPIVNLYSAKDMDDFDDRLLELADCICIIHPNGELLYMMFPTD